MIDSRNVKEKDSWGGTSFLRGSMTTATTLFAALDETLRRTDVKCFSQYVLGTPFMQLKKMVYPKPPYKSFIIKKRNGDPRVIDEPRQRLKVIQKEILAFLEQRAGPIKPAVHGFVRKRSILTNARKHCSPTTHHILNLDLKDFFPSITFRRVRGALRKYPFHFSHEVASLLAHICTLNGTLPQGAPTSPFLSNMLCRTMDRDLTDLARRYRATYTRYADDLTLSFNVRSAERLPPAICIVDDGLVTPGIELTELITTKHGFTINPSKTRLCNRFSRMEVTGLTVNKFPNVQRHFIDKIRGALHAWEKYGYDKAQAEWDKRIADTAAGPYEKKQWKRQTRVHVAPKLKNVLWGKLLHVRMVRGKEDALYTRLAERYNSVCATERLSGPFVCSSLPVEPVARDYKTAEDAVFVLEWLGEYHSTPGVNEDVVGGQGTAFVYRELNLLVTCDHVLNGIAKIGKDFQVPTDYGAPEIVNKTLQLMHPRTKRAWPAKILYRNAQMDIALLAFDMVEPPAHRYFSAMDSPIKIRAGGVLIGFPAYQNWNRPDFLDEKVLNRTEPNKGMISFTISGAGSIRPGNSGGLFVDDRFRVAGVAQRGAHMGTGHDECLCFTLLDQCIANWKMSQQLQMPPANTATPTEPPTGPIALAAPSPTTEAKL